MEKYFNITEQSIMHKDWFDYKKNLNDIRKLVKEFFGSHGIGATEYYVTNDEIHIVPSEKDTKDFNSSLCTPIVNGLCKFKKSSSVSKSWIRVLKDADIRVLNKPMLILYFGAFSGGKFRSRIFDRDGNLYCSIDPANGELPKGFVEMKASEFFKIVEEEAGTA